MPQSISRNVVLSDYYGGVIAGFYQYGTVTWAMFFQWLATLVTSVEPYIILHGDRFDSEQYFSTDAIVMPGKYTLLAADWSPLYVGLTDERARRRQPTPLRAQCNDRGPSRAAARDGKCMVSGHMWGRLQAAHIFSRAHEEEWETAGYMALITDTAADRVEGGFSKISSVQNVVLFSADLHGPWGNYQFGVDPDDDYRITAFVPGLDGVVGRALLLDHITDPTTRPLDSLLRDHFRQCLLKHVKGRGERQWDYARTFGAGAFDLSDVAVWGTEEGKERLELELEVRLFEHRLLQGDGEGGGDESGLVTSPRLIAV